MRLEVETTTGGRLLLDGVAERVDKPWAALRAADEEFRKREARIFATGNGGSWAPDDLSTVKTKGSARVLVDSGDLLASLTRVGDRYHVRQVNGDSITLGTRNPVAHLHAKGARGMPRRNPVPPTTAAERGVYAADLLDYFLEGEA